MDNHFEDIDGVFKQRFEGRRDHSIDPGAQWSSVSQGLSSGAGATATAASTASTWAAAASIAVIATVGVTVQQDQPAILQANLPVASEATISPASNVASASVPEESLQEVVQGAFASLDSGDASKDGFIEEVSKTLLAEAPAERIQLEDVAMDQATSSPIDFDVFEETEFADRHGLALMETWSQDEANHGILIRSIEPHDLQPKRIISSHKMFVRAGGRVGNGESNTEHNPSGWRVNGLVSVGYSYRFTEKTFVSFEAGYLRRTGYGVERSKHVDLTPLVALLTSSNNGSDALDLSAYSLDIRESLVATSMDVLHMPVLVHVDLSPKSNISVGAYGEYLIATTNEAYMVYNSEEYVEAGLSVGDASSKEGLKSVRAGLVGGFERKITSRLSTDIRAMIPISSIQDQSSEYTTFRAPNQLVDLQVSLKYEI